MFYYCRDLTSLPDISKWNLSNLNNEKTYYLFKECTSLSSLPDLKFLSNDESSFRECLSINNIH